METIAIEVATYNNQSKQFDFRIQHRFPSTAKGLALAVIAAERMMNIDAHHLAFAEIVIKFMSNDEVGEQLDDVKFFELIEHHRARLSILAECLAITNDRAA